MKKKCSILQDCAKLSFEVVVAVDAVTRKAYREF